MQRPIIGVTTTNLKALSGIPDTVPESWVMSHRFVTAPAQAGGLPWMLPLIEDEATLRGMYEGVHGLLVPGGADVDPTTYGEERHERCERSDPPRDRVELQLIRWALEDGKPVLGICRGIQLINLAHGGSLYQDLGAQCAGSVKHDYFPNQGFARDHLIHDVRIEAGSRLAGILGAQVLRVNSMHHQAVDRVGDGLLVSARSAEDDVVEGVEVSDHPFMIGVQWHPEALSERDPVMRALFTGLVEAAAAHRERSENAATSPERTR